MPNNINPYTETLWKNLPSKVSPIVAEHLNNIEFGIKSITDFLNSLDRTSGVRLSGVAFTQALKDKLDSCEVNANYYVLPKATSSTIGGVMINPTTLVIANDGTISVVVIDELSDLQDVDVTGLVDEQILKWDAEEEEFLPITQQEPIKELALLTDVELDNLDDGHILLYDSTDQKWHNIKAKQFLVLNYEDTLDYLETGDITVPAGKDIVVGDMDALSFWLNSLQYDKTDINEMFAMSNGSEAMYNLAIADIYDAVVTIDGQTSGQHYEKGLPDGYLEYLYFFASGEQIILSDGTHTITKTLTNQTDYIRLNTGKNYIFRHVNIDPTHSTHEIINNKEMKKFVPDPCMVLSDSMRCIPELPQGFYVNNSSYIINNYNWPETEAWEYPDDGPYGSLVEKQRFSYIRTGVYIKQGEQFTLGANATDVDTYTAAKTGELIIKFVQKTKGDRSGSAGNYSYTYIYHLLVGCDIIPFGISVDEYYDRDGVAAYTFDSAEYAIIHRFSADKTSLSETFQDIYITF